jgi:hypothetical protein
VTLYLLTFALCTAAADPATGVRSCEQGEVTHRSCAFAEAYVRAGMLPGKVLHVQSCEVVGE